MRILCGVFPPTSGRAIVAGYDVVTDSLRARGVVGYCPERVALYLDMTVREYLRYVAEMKGLDARASRRAAIDAALEQLRRGARGATPDRHAVEGLPPARRHRAGAGRASRAC